MDRRRYDLQVLCLCVVFWRYCAYSTGQSAHRLEKLTQNNTPSCKMTPCFGFFYFVIKQPYTLMCMYFCIYVALYVIMYVYIYICMCLYIYMYVCMCIYVNVCIMYICMYACTRVYVCVCVYVGIYIYVRVCLYTCKCT
jgi:hypothetical protein